MRWNKINKWGVFNWIKSTINLIVKSFIGWTCLFLLKVYLKDKGIKSVVGFDICTSMNIIAFFITIWIFILIIEHGLATRYLLMGDNEK